VIKCEMLVVIRIVVAAVDLSDAYVVYTIAVKVYLHIYTC